LLGFFIPLFALYRGTPRADGAWAAVVYQRVRGTRTRPPARLRAYQLYARSSAWRRLVRVFDYAMAPPRWARNDVRSPRACRRTPPPSELVACACCVAIMRRARVATVRPHCAAERPCLLKLRSRRRVECLNRTKRSVLASLRR
jgi:hypothetical protein